MKRLLLIVILIFSVFFMFAGCAVPSAVPVSNERSRDAKECGEKLLDSIRENDYRQFHACYERSNQEEFTLACKLMTEQFGKIDHSEYLARMNTPGGLENHVWRVVFSRRDRAGKEIKQDVLFRIISGRDGDKERIIAMGFL